MSDYARYRDLRGRTIKVRTNTTFRGSPMRTRQSPYYYQGDSYVPSGWFPIDFSTWVLFALATETDSCDTDVMPQELYNEVGVGYNTDTGYAEQSVGEYGDSQGTDYSQQPDTTQQFEQPSGGYEGSYDNSGYGQSAPQESYAPAPEPQQSYSPPPSYDTPSYDPGPSSDSGSWG